MMKIVCGLPGSGKTTYVAEHMVPGDIVYDYDAIKAALTNTDPHANRSLGTAHEVTNAIFNLILDRDYSDATMWIIRCALSAGEVDTARQHGAQFIILNVDAETCRNRVNARDGERDIDYSAMSEQLNAMKAKLNT